MGEGTAPKYFFKGTFERRIILALMFLFFLSFSFLLFHFLIRVWKLDLKFLVKIENNWSHHYDNQFPQWVQRVQFMSKRSEGEAFSVKANDDNGSGL